MTDKIRLQESLKCQVFVAHVQRHLNLGQTDESMIRMVEGMSPLIHPVRRRIPTGKVGCKICERSIDQIWRRERKDWIGAST